MSRTNFIATEIGSLFIRDNDQAHILALRNIINR